MPDIAIRVDNLSKLYPARSLAVWHPGVGWAGHLGAVHQRPDTLRDALTGMFRRGNQSTNPQSPNPDDLWALRDVSFEACPELDRRVKRGEVVGLPAGMARTCAFGNTAS